MRCADFVSFSLGNFLASYQFQNRIAEQKFIHTVDMILLIRPFSGKIDNSFSLPPRMSALY